MPAAISIFSILLSHHTKLENKLSNLSSEAESIEQQQRRSAQSDDPNPAA